VEELVHLAGIALYLEQHAAGVVEHVAGEAELAREPVHVGPEADALDGPLDPRPGAAAQGTHPTSARSAWYALACASWIRGMCSERVTITWSARPSAPIRPPS